VRLRFFGLALVIAVLGQYLFDFPLGDGFLFAFAADISKEQLGNIGVVANHDKNRRDHLLPWFCLLRQIEPLRPLS
jgi:hypothetical protein